MNEEISTSVDRSIQIGQDAIGNAIISGSGNVVIIESSPRRRLDEPETPQASQIGPNPYVGLSAFLETEADRFFGRDEQIAKLWDKLHDLLQDSADAKPKTRLLPILGPSGSGKSSVARAGLIPELARRPLTGLREPRVAVITPGAHPLESLAKILARIETKDPMPAAKAREFAGELKLANGEGQFDGLRRIAGLLPDIESSPLIVFVDQFEEIYSLCEDQAERQAFIENLLHAASDTSRHVSVVITLRTDFLGETQRHEALNALICNDRQHVMIPSMNEEELREAITKPSELAGHALDEATVDLLIKDTKDHEGTLPLMQFALTKIWDGFADGKTAAETYREIGGVGGALAKEAQRVYDGLSDQGKRVAKRVFLGLVQLGEGTRDTRRRAPVDEFVSVTQDAGEVDRVVRRFASRDARLITLSSVSKEGGESTEAARPVDMAEVTHEALFEHWEQLNEWLDENREDIRFSRRLDESAQTWHREGRPDGGLWRPPYLDLLRDFHERVGNDMSTLHMDFFIASQQADKLRVAKEKRQQLVLRSLLGTATVATVVAVWMLVLAVGASKDEKAAKWAAQEGQVDALADAILLSPPATARDRMDRLADVLEESSLRDYALRQLQAKLDEPPPAEGSPDEINKLASGKANLAVALFEFDGIESIRRYLSHPDAQEPFDTTLRTHLIHRFNEAAADPEPILDQLEKEAEPSILQALLLAAGEFEKTEITDERRGEVAPKVEQVYKSHPDSGVHAAAEWLLRQWGRHQLVRDIDKQLAGKDQADRDWNVSEFGLKMVAIREGTFQMGSPDSDPDDQSNEKPQHSVKVPRFYLSQCEVTQYQYRALMGENLSFDDDLSDAPVTDVRWLDAVAFCNKLSDEEDLPRYYKDDGSIAGGNGYRLPTEAEWEYACRAGTTSRWSCGDDEASLGHYSWYYKNGRGTSSVGEKKPNTWGLFDMHGNVEEWCWDWYAGDYYAKSPTDDPPGPAVGNGRVFRGGSFYADAHVVRSADRSYNVPGYRYDSFGFRLARTYN